MQITKRTTIAGLIGAMMMNTLLAPNPASADPLQAAFDAPPQQAKPWVYWYFMDGHITREGLTNDLEAMKKAGIGGAIFLTISLGVPKPPHPVEFMSPEWQQLYKHMIREADRLGIAISLGVGPGWSGDGGPWLKPEQTMQHLVASVTPVTGGKPVDVMLPRPVQREPFFGRASLAQKWMLDAWTNFYRDECVLAYPTPKGRATVPYVDEKALYFRAPYSSRSNVRPFFDAPADPAAAPAEACLDRAKVIDISDKLDKDGRLKWTAPPGEWTVYRFGRTLQGQNTRPSPAAGMGFESDKFSAAALAAHAKAFLEPLIAEAGKPSGPDRGLTTLHLDSWEMGAQNWTADFREKFKARRGYDPLPYLPAMIGQYVTDAATTERFLWDLRQTARELVHDEHLVPLRELAHKNGLRFSIEGYDMNPAGDLMTLGTGDVQMGEFWSQGFGFSSEFSVFEATSAAHTKGQPIVGAESFTANADDKWQQHPASMKRQGDWALAAGINRFVFHRYQHQPKENQFPGQRMGPYGVFWERTQTWWDMVPAYHDYIARASAVLQRGVAVADVLYLAPEGAPHVFRAPKSATVLQGGLPDRRGYAFDGVDPDRLMDATVENGRVAFPGGTNYAVMVLPEYDTMTLPLMKKVKALLDDGATVIGPRPLRSPGLGSRGDDATIAALSAELWANVPPDGKRVGRGILFDDNQPRPAIAPPDPMWGSKWIWADDGEKGPVTRAGECFFEAALDLDSLNGVESAELIMRADDSFRASVNGHDVGEGSGVRELARFDVTADLKVGKNVLAVAARNDAADSPAGLIGGLLVHYRDGRTLALRSDASWLCATTRDGVKKKSEVIIGTPDAWRDAQPGPVYRDLYVDYDTTARVLKTQGLAPDFEADAPLRYGHRRDGDEDIYFVANTTEQPVDTTCVFRVAGRTPEWWDPMTGKRRPLPEHKEADGRTTVPLHFEAAGSGFVVFRRVPDAAPVAGKNIRPESVVATIDGPWDVAFDPKWGGPAAVRFTALDDWSKRPEPGIRGYSGTAVYRKSFDITPGDAADKANVLSLGDVRAMARVRLNGRDLGVAWCVPWTLDVPPGLLRPTGNELEVSVANLWVNRLIADAGLPEGQRLTKTTSNPYKADDKPKPSGLLGPVQLRSRPD